MEKSASCTSWSIWVTSTSMLSRVMFLFASIAATRDSMSRTLPLAVRTSFGDQVTCAPRSQVVLKTFDGGM